MKNQRDVFKASEADEWFNRNKAAYDSEENKKNLIVKILNDIELIPGRMLEIGCSNGFRLNQIREAFNCECFGIDPSAKAIQDGMEKFPSVNLSVGTADALKFEDNSFDIILFGFCLYLCDRKDLFKIACEADRCLRNEGTLILLDFHPPFPYRNQYAYHAGLYSYKMDYAAMFTWNPAYTEVYKVIFTHTGYGLRDVPDERVATVVLRKNESFAYPVEPFGR